MVPRTRIVALIGLALTSGCRPAPSGPTPVPPGPRLAWVFEAPRPGSVLATPAVTSDAIYLAASHPRGPDHTGAVYALDPVTGKVRWTFDRGGTMLPTASSPLAAGGRLFVGEGMHGHFACRLQCGDATTGRPLWDRPVGDHIEGGPALSGTLILFSAGNEGLHAVESASGKLTWTFRADLHIDSTPAVVGARAYVGSGTSRRFQNFQVVCLDATTGNPVWRTPVPLPAWGNPLVVEGRVYVGLGTGRLTESARPPAGALACLDAASGTLIWTFSAGDAVFGRPAAVGKRIVFGSRDGNVYGMEPNGREAFRVAMGGPVVAGMAAAGDRAYAVSVTGRVVCLDAASGREEWRHDLARPGGEPQVFAAPVIVGGRLYIAAEMTAGQAGIVTLFCFDLPAGDGGNP